MTPALSLPNGAAVPLADVPQLTVPEFHESVLQSVENGGRIAALFGCPAGDSVLLLLVIAWFF